jgi:hypothetical protein
MDAEEHRRGSVDLIYMFHYRPRGRYIRPFHRRRNVPPLEESRIMARCEVRSHESFVPRRKLRILVRLGAYYYLSRMATSLLPPLSIHTTSLFTR